MKGLTGAVWLVMVRWVSHKTCSKPDTGIDTYICIPCNLDDETMKPWLLQHVPGLPPPEGPHSVQHTLALVIDSSVTSEPGISTEALLDRLEKKFEEQAAASLALQNAFRELNDRFENHEKVMQERMEEGFRLLHQALAHKEQRSSG